MQDQALHVSPAPRSELVRLLTNCCVFGHPAVPATPCAGSAGASITSAVSVVAASLAMKNHPRHLFHSGNMYFANSVLQVSVYCPPFHRLFSELWRVGGSGKTEGGSRCVEESKYSDVDTTVEFLNEFVG